MTGNWNRFRNKAEAYYQALDAKEALLRMWEASPDADKEYVKDLRARVHRMRVHYALRQHPVEDL